MSGPYDTETQVWAEPMPQQVRALQLVARDDPHRVKYDTLVAACATAHVEPGTYGLGKLAWLARWEPDLAQVVADLIVRAHEAGRAGLGAVESV